MIMALVTAGADLMVRSGDGSPPLHEAVSTVWSDLRSELGADASSASGVSQEWLYIASL